MNRAEWLGELNQNSIAERPWQKPGYRFRPMSQHTQEGHTFRAERPYFGWVDVLVQDVNLAMFTNNDDGVANIYHMFGPDAYERASVAAWLEIARQSRNVADVGSFSGLFAMLAQKAVPEAKVIAVEPNGAARARLMMNLVVNGLYPKLEVVPYAVSERVGVLSLHIGLGADLLDTGGSIVGSQAITTRTETVGVISLDALMQQSGFESVDLMKIDVEGAEIGALLGGQATLKHGPTLFLEIQGTKEFSGCWDILKSHGYRILGIDDEAVSLIPYDGSDPASWLERHIGNRVINYLCVAREEHVQTAELGISRIRSMMT